MATKVSSIRSIERRHPPRKRPDFCTYDGKQYSAAEVEEERQKNFGDILRFGRRALPHWFTAPSSRFHKYLDKRIRRMACGQGGTEHVVLAPRGNAKSTLVSKTSVLWIIAHQIEILQANGNVPLDCIVIISYALGLPVSFIIDIKRELETNSYLRAFYPECFGAGREKWTEQKIRTNNGVWVCAGSTGQSIRGILPENKRPRWVVLDDCESMEHAATEKQREKIWKWLFSDVRPTGEAPERKADILAVGTLVHRDSMISRLRKEFWSSRPFKAVRHFADNQELWDTWRDMYLDIEGEMADARKAATRLWNDTHQRLLDAIDNGEDPDDADTYLHQWWEDAFKAAADGLPEHDNDLREAYQEALFFVEDYRDELPDAIDEVADEWENAVLEAIREIIGRRSKARKFFEDNHDEMMKGVRVLWPEAQPYYRLMQLMAENPIAFMQEMQNEIRLSADQLFSRDAWSFYHVDRARPTPEYMKSLFPKGTIFVGACDPSMGKQSKKHDPAAIIILAKPPGGRWCIAWAWVRREKPSEILRRIIELNVVFKCRGWAVEAVQFQEYFADDIVEKAEAAGVPVRVHKYRDQTPKEIRIRGLEPHVVNGRILFPGRRVTTDNGDYFIPITAGGFRHLWEQFEWFGESDIHDDGPDATEMAWSEAMRVTRAGQTQVQWTRTNRTGRSYQDPLADGAEDIRQQEEDERQRRDDFERERERRKNEVDDRDVLQKLRRLGLLGKRY